MKFDKKKTFFATGFGYSETYRKKVFTIFFLPVYYSIFHKLQVTNKICFILKTWSTKEIARISLNERKTVPRNSVNKSYNSHN